MSRKNRLLPAFMAGCAALALSVAGCSSAAPRPGQAPLASATSTTAANPPTAAGPARRVDHVVIIVEENKPASSILGNAAAPFINKLAAENASATNYTAVTHPSLPNYLALTSGTTAGITDDCSPGSGCTVRVPSIADSLVRAGLSWKMYAESMPAPCSPSSSGNYAVKHNPFMYYPSVTTEPAYCAAHVVTFERLATDLQSAASLPNYVFISPNLCNDMHDCPVATGDAWLAHQVPAILASPAFTQQNSLLVVTWDEGEGANNAVSTIFAGPAARHGATSSVAYNHYSLLHTIETLLGLAPLGGNDTKAAVMGDMLN